VKTINELPEFNEFTAPDFGADIDWVADELFARPQQGLMQHPEVGLIAYRNEDLWALGRHDDISHLVAFYGNDEIQQRFQLASTFSMTPPVHGPGKMLLTRRLSPKSLGAYMGVADQILRDLLADKAGTGTVDFVHDLMRPLMVVFWREAIGLTHEEGEAAAHCIEKAFLSFQIAPTEEELAIADRATDDYLDILEPALKREMAKGVHPILNSLKADYEQMPEGEVGRPRDVYAHFGAAIGDAFHTLGGATTGVVHSLLEQPGALAEVRENRSLLTNAWQEGIRLNAAAIGVPHGAVRDLIYNDIEIPAGTPIMLLWAFGNRDPEAFARPNAFALHRENRGLQTSFGAGAYACPGGSLARLLGHVVLDVVTRPEIDVALAGKPRWCAPAWVRQIEHLPVTVEQGK
jgi:cytochrome P450